MPIQKKKENWEELKQYLLSVHKEYEDRNGLDYCKNCGVNMKMLVDEFELLLYRARQEEEKRIITLLFKV